MMLQRHPVLMMMTESSLPQDIHVHVCRHRPTYTDMSLKEWGMMSEGFSGRSICETPKIHIKLLPSANMTATQLHNYQGKDLCDSEGSAAVG